MCRTFNCGIGLSLITSSDNVSTVLGELCAAGESHAAVIGSVVSLNTGMNPTYIYMCVHILVCCQYVLLLLL